MFAALNMPQPVDKAVYVAVCLMEPSYLDNRFSGMWLGQHWNLLRIFVRSCDLTLVPPRYFSVLNLQVSF